MATITAPAAKPAVVYPESDGQPMAENTRQFRWITTIQGNLDLLFADRPDVFVAGDHLIYPLEGDNQTRIAPDVYVAFGRPKGDRGSYKVWEEAGIFPQVVFEVLSPSNSYAEMRNKRRFYERFGCEEFVVIDPDPPEPVLEAWVRNGRRLEPVEIGGGWVSPRLGLRFGPAAEMSYPDGRPFLTFVELGQLQQRTAAQAEQERIRAEQERQRREQLAAKLRELGVDPDAV